MGRQYTLENIISATERAYGMCPENVVALETASDSSEWDALPGDALRTAEYDACRYAEFLDSVIAELQNRAATLSEHVGRAQEEMMTREYGARDDDPYLYAERAASTNERA